MVKIQTDYRDHADIIRMCERRIRSFETWYGDYLAALGACRLAERRLQELGAAFGLATIRAFVAGWLDYSEQMAAEAISELPAGRVVAETCLDPFPRLPDGIPLRATIDVDPAAGKVLVDLRDNPDCTPTGLNLTESTSKNSATTAILMVLNSDPAAKQIKVPNNSGAYRRIEVLVRENCVVGIPRHPASASVATNTVADRVVGMIISGMSAMGDGVGAAQPCFGSPPWNGVVSGHDARRAGAQYVFQIFSGTAGGPATPQSDGWMCFVNTGGAGIEYIDSTEVIEQKYPLVVWEKVVRRDSEGAGRTRGACGNISIYGPRFGPMDEQHFLDGVVNRPRGVRGGGWSQGPEAWVSAGAGDARREDSAVGQVVVPRGGVIMSLSAGGGGYGPPVDRDPGRVLRDVIDGFVSPRRARERYGVVLAGDLECWESLSVDDIATAALRARLRTSGELDLVADDATRAPFELDCWWLEPRPPVSAAV
jgi:N-methylhydantoinase B